MQDEHGSQRAKQILMLTHLGVQNALQKPTVKAGPVLRWGCHNQPTTCDLKHGFFHLWRESSDGDVDGPMEMWMVQQKCDVDSPTEIRGKFTSN